MWLWRVTFVVFPAERLRNAESSPLVLRENPQSPYLGIKVVAGDHLQHRFGEHDVSVFIGVVGVAGRVVYGVLELKHACALLVSELPALEGAEVLVHAVVYFLVCLYAVYPVPDYITPFLSSPVNQMSDLWTVVMQTKACVTLEDRAVCVCVFLHRRGRREENIRVSRLCVVLGLCALIVSRRCLPGWYEGWIFFHLELSKP